MKSQIIRSKILNAQLLGLLSICFLVAVQLVLAYFKLLGGVEASWDIILTPFYIIILTILAVVSVVLVLEKKFYAYREKEVLKH